MNTKISLHVASAVILTFGLTACGGDKGDAAMDGKAKMTMDSHDHGGTKSDDHDMKSMTADTDHGTGKIVEIDTEGRRIKLNHGELTNIGMSAMTMFFAIGGDVDLSTFEIDDDVSFMLKKGRDGSYRIMALCDMGAEVSDCLVGEMGHSGH